MVSRSLFMLSGALAVVGIGIASLSVNGPVLVDTIRHDAEAARDEAGAKSVKIRLRTEQGWLTRHAVLEGGGGLSDEVRAAAATAIAAVPGIGGVRWQASDLDGPGGGSGLGALHCQEDVEAVLETRTVRFSEASAAIDPASEELLNEVATALKPCVGSVIAITGHTDGAGDETANIALSRARANAVRWALIGRGIPADGLRAEGKGSSEPVEGLVESDPANRRIEFSVIETAPLRPTPIDTPGPG
jgi:OOP family OmpA-OmpF porin